MRKFLFYLGLLAMLVWAGVRIYHGIQFDRQVEGYLKLAADATNIELAEDRLGIAIDGMEERGLCGNYDSEQCYTSLLWTTPDEDVTFWRQNTAQALAELRELPRDADALTVSNTLMKVRETLLDEGQSVRVTTPSGISVYPNNAAYAWWGLGSFLLLCLCAGHWLWKDRDDIF